MHGCTRVILWPASYQTSVANRGSRFARRDVVRNSGRVPKALIGDCELKVVMALIITRPPQAFSDHDCNEHEGTDSKTAIGKLVCASAIGIAGLSG